MTADEITFSKQLCRDCIYFHPQPWDGIWCEKYSDVYEAINNSTIKVNKKPNDNSTPSTQSFQYTRVGAVFCKYYKSKTDKHWFDWLR